MQILPASTLILSAVASLGLLSASDGTSSTCSARTASATPGADQSLVETAVAAGNFQTLVQALRAAKLVDALEGEGPFTVFAPTDEAFAKLPPKTLEQLLKPEGASALKTILTYHVVPGDIRAAQVVELAYADSLNGQRIPVQAGKQGVHVAGASVQATDILCKNGVIHVVDRVLMPATANLVETATEAGSFTILTKALGAAELVEALSAPGPFTVFAPTDEAFRKLPQETLAALLLPENRHQLVAILKHHVVAGRVYADQLARKELHALDGNRLEVRLHEGAARVGGAGVSKADIETTNGVIHVIDTVLLPST